MHRLCIKQISFCAIHLISFSQLETALLFPFLSLPYLGPHDSILSEGVLFHLDDLRELIIKCPAYRWSYPLSQLAVTSWMWVCTNRSYPMQLTDGRVNWSKPYYWLENAVLYVKYRPLCLLCIMLLLPSSRKGSSSGEGCIHSLSCNRSFLLEHMLILRVDLKEKKKEISSHLGEQISAVCL